MKTHSLAERWRYYFDGLMSKGPIAMIALLAILSLLVVLLAGLILWIFAIHPEGQEPMHFIEGTWQSLMRAMDSGTISGDGGWTFRAVAFLVTLGGIFILSTLIGVLSSGIEGKLSELRKGRSMVIEKDHTLILGWSPKIFTIISELIIANENQKKPRIVILADVDKVEMEDRIFEHISDFKNTKVICRNGNPHDLSDLAIANVGECKSVIILAAEEGNTDPLTIKSILAITNDPHRRETPYHIIAEIREEKNLEIARMVGKDEVELILTDDIIGRIMVQTSRQSGLSIVYTELMNFEGAEIYFKEESALVGKTYGDAVLAYEDSSVIGLQFTDGKVKVNPEMSQVIMNGDKVICITEDDETLRLSQKTDYGIKEELIVNRDSAVFETERVLILGWNRRAMVNIREMDNYVAPGSYLKVVSTYDKDKENIMAVAATLNNIQLEFVQADTTMREVIDGLDVTSYQSIQLLCYKDEMNMQDADAQTLIALLHIRRIMEETGKDIKIVSEMLDLRTRELAEVTKADDFIVSDRLISLMMSQVSENKHLMRVFEDMLSANGSEIYLKPISDYIKTGVEVDFYTIMESARRKGQTAIGYRIVSYAHDSEKAYGVVVNPVKSRKLKFDEADRLIVLAED